jgi:integrase
MPRSLHRLTSRQVDTLGPGRHADGGGLYLDREASGRSRWIFFVSAGGKRREMGLGPAGGPGAVPLARARQLAQEARDMVRAGLDPIEERRRREAEAAAPVRRVPTFGEEADELVRVMAPSWRNEKHIAQWRTTLGGEPYDLSRVRIDRKAHDEHVTALTRLRGLAVDTVTTDDVLSALRPLWLAAPETASRVRGRIEAVLAAATAKGHRAGPNPALWRGHLDRLLPPRHRLTRGHHGAMPFTDVPAFMGRLRASASTSALALEFTILTASRTGEVRGALWREVDLDKAVWTVPGVRMKAGRDHRVALSGRAVAILHEMRKLGADPNGFVFPGRSRDGGLSVMAMEMTLRRMGVKDDNVTVHGFRSSFRDWAGEVSHFPREVAEAALAHVVGDSTERAYRRGDALEKRRMLMEEWAQWCEPREAGSNVVPMARVLA